MVKKTAFNNKNVNIYSKYKCICDKASENAGRTTGLTDVYGILGSEYRIWICI